MEESMRSAVNFRQGLCNLLDMEGHHDRTQRLPWELSDSSIAGSVTCVDTADRRSDDDHGFDVSSESDFFRQTTSVFERGLLDFGR